MILLFGIAREIVGKNKLEWPSEEIQDVGQLKRWILKTFPEFRDLASLRIAVNEEYAEDDLKIHSSDEIVLIPPVAGG